MKLCGDCGGRGIERAYFDEVNDEYLSMDECKDCGSTKIMEEIINQKEVIK